MSTIEPVSCLQKDVDYPGNDINGKCGEQPEKWRREDPSDCIALCKSVEGCDHFTWVSTESEWNDGRKRCCLKKGNPVVQKSFNVVSAVVSNCEGI